MVEGGMGGRGGGGMGGRGGGSRGRMVLGTGYRVSDTGAAIQTYSRVGWMERQRNPICRESWML